MYSTVFEFFISSYLLIMYEVQVCF